MLMIQCRYCEFILYYDFEIFVHYFYFGGCKDSSHPPLDNTTKFPNLEVGESSFLWFEHFQMSQGLRRNGKENCDNLGHLNE